MPDLQGLITYPGIVGLIEGEMTLAPGITPGYCRIRMPPQPKVLEIKPAELKITYGGTVLKFPDAIIDDGSLDIGAAGLIWSIRILDRRWKWRYGDISGRYNFRRADNSVEKDTEKAPRELAALLFKAMGEDAPLPAQLAALPNDTRPEVDWVAENPAQALRLLRLTVCQLLPNES